MKNFLVNYKGPIAMIAGVLLGAACGIIWPEVAHSLKFIGDIFLNLLFTLVIPLVFFSITIAFFRLARDGSLAKILLRTIICFVAIWIVCGTLSYFAMFFWSPSGNFDLGMMLQGNCPASQTRGNFLVEMFSVSDFTLLFSKSHILPLVIFSALLGVSASKALGQKENFQHVMETGNTIICKALEIVMYCAPVGLGCYFAETTASFGAKIISDYLEIFIIYCTIALLVIFVVYPLLIRSRYDWKKVKSYAVNITPPSITALSTASSSIAMPGNIEAAIATGVNKSVSMAIVPLATNLLKSGSIIADVMKVIFLMTLSGSSIHGVGTFFTILLIAVVAAIVSGAVTNGSVTGEIIICSMLGINPEMVGMIMIIGTIIDIPATLLNSEGCVVAALLIDKQTEKNDEPKTH